VADVSVSGAINPTNPDVTNGVTDPALGSTLLARAATRLGIDVDKLAQNFSTAATTDPKTAVQSVSRLLQQMTPVEQGAFLGKVTDPALASELRVATMTNGATIPTSSKAMFLAGPAPILPPPAPKPPAGGTPIDGQDKAVNNWLNSLGGAVSQDDKTKLAQTANDAQLLKSFFDSHDRGDPALNSPPKDVADAEDRLLSNPSISQQIHSGDKVTRDALGDFIKHVDDAAKSATSSFQSFQKNNKNATPDELAAAAQASILQGSLPIIDASGSSAAKVDGTFNLDDLKAIAGSRDAGVPDPLKKAAESYSNQASFNSLVKAGDAGDGLVNDKGLGKVVSDGVGLSRQDGNVHDWIDHLGGAVSDDDKTQLAQIGDDATTLKAWFDAHDRGDPALNDMPQNVADAQRRLAGNDAVARRIESQSGDDKGSITRDNLGGFLDDLNKAADNAKGSWDSFKKDNPDADPIALRSAADASILQANLPVLDAAGSSAAKVDSEINLDDVKAIAGAGNSLPAPLVAAASHFSNAGEFHKLDQAGDSDPSTPADGIVANGNFDYYLGHATPKTSDDTNTDLKTSAIEQAVKDAGGDASKVNGDYFKDPAKSSASGADKAAAMIQMSETVARYQNGEKAYVETGGPNVLSSPDQYHQYYDGPTPGEQRDAYIKDIQGKISTLAQDKDVQSFMTDQMPKALQTMVSKDPGLKDSFQKAYDDASSSKALQDAFNGKDKDGKPLTTTAALSSFLQNPNFYAQGLGITPDYTKAFSGAPQDIKDKITQGYSDITSGKAYDDLTKGGTPADQALIQSAVDKTAYDSVLDKDTVTKGSDAFNETVSAKARDDLTGKLSGDDMIKGLGVSGADDPKLEQFIKDNIDTLSDPGGDQARPQDILSAARQINDLFRSGVKFDDAMSKAKESWSSPSGPVTDAYKAGVLHGASALLLAGAMGARLGTSGGNDNPLQTAQQSLSATGLLAEGGAKYAGGTNGYKDKVAAAQQALDQAKANATGPNDPAVKSAQASYDHWSNIAKDVENTGKLVGGVAGNALGLVTGVIGAKGAADAGDIGGAAAQGIFAGLNGISSIASAGEVATYIAPRIASALGSSLTDAAAASAAAWGGVFGAVGGVVGGVAAVGGLLYGIIKGIIDDNKQAASEQNWYKELQDGFAPAGTPLPDLGVLIAAPNGYVPDGPLPAANY
jgi:hypothetical protein